MDRLDDCRRKLRNFLKDLRTMGDEGTSSEDYQLAEERIVRWKERVIKFLRQNVSDAETARLQKKRSVLYVGMGRSKDSLVGTVKQYTTYLSALMKEIEKNPEMIVRESAEDHAIQTVQPTVVEGKSVFLVHGHGEIAKLEVARFLKKGGLDVTILREKSNKGRTIIEKFEDYSDVAYAVVLLTADDVGGICSSNQKLQPRARQNVVFEFGFFMGKLGRNKVCALCQEGVEKPSDIDGLVYILLDKSGAWKMKLAKELKSAGIDIDLDKAS